MPEVDLPSPETLAKARITAGRQTMGAGTTPVSFTAGSSKPSTAPGTKDYLGNKRPWGRPWFHLKSHSGIMTHGDHPGEGEGRELTFQKPLLGARNVMYFLSPYANPERWVSSSLIDR